MNTIYNTIKTVFTKPVYTGLFWLVLRFYVGYEFVTAGWEKLESGKWIGGNAIAGFLGGALAKTTGAHPEVQGWYADLVKNVFLPNAVLLSTLVAIGETLVGLALIFGVLTKFAAFWGAVMNLAFVSAGVTSSNATMLVFEVAMVFAGAGVAYYGIDRFLLPALKKALHISGAEPKAITPIPTRGSLPTARPAR
jgi:thiosulfate dehydrogenase (quinone) large subunit